MKKILFSKFFRYFVIFLVLSSVFCVYLFKNIYNELENSFYDYFIASNPDNNGYADINANLKIFYAMEELTSYQSVVDVEKNLYSGSVDQIIKVFGDKNNYIQYKNHISYIPTITSLEKRLKEKRESLYTVKEPLIKYSFFRTTSKRMVTYAVYCLSQNKLDEYVDIIDKFAGLSVIVAWGNMGKTTLIDYSIGLAIKDLVNQAVLLGIAKDKSKYSELYNIPVKLSLSQKNKIINILNILQSGFPTVKETIQGEKSAVLSFIDQFEKDNPVKMFYLNLISKPFSTTQKDLANFYDKNIELLNDVEKLKDFTEKSRRSGNLIVRSLIPNFSKALINMIEYKNQTDKIIETLNK